MQCIYPFTPGSHGHPRPAQALKPDGSTVGKIPLNRGTAELVPILNAHILNTLIPHSELKVFNCGHLFLLTRADETVRVMNEFLDRPDMNGRQQ
jgi:hypothetical protein